MDEYQQRLLSGRSLVLDLSTSVFPVLPLFSTSGFSHSITSTRMLSVTYSAETNYKPHAFQGPDHQTTCSNIKNKIDGIFKETYEYSSKISSKLRFATRFKT